MRAVSALALLVCACGRGQSGDAPGVSGALPSAGPDPVVVRIPLDGGTARAYLYPGLDSLIWKSAQPTPSIDRVLAFDAENGMLAYLSRDGAPGWLDLRLGTVRLASKERLTSLTSSDGYSIFGVSATNAVVRLTPSGDWALPSKRKIRRLFPLADGSLLVLADAGEKSVLLRLRPPDESITDSLQITRPGRAVPTPLGDRLYLGISRELVSVQPRSFETVDRVKAGDDILAIVPTPSGDRIFVANKGGPRLEVMDRYAEDIEQSVTLPGLATELRMDPMGRFLLARPVQGDSAWVVAIANDEFVGTVQTAWRVDLPAVTVDGLIAAARGMDVAFVEPLKGTVVRRAPGGASDLWFFAVWNGFRARARGLDVPVSFSLGERSGVTDSIADSLQRPATEIGTQRRDSARAEDTAPSAPVEPTPPAVTRDAWTVSFAAVLSEDRAREIAATISVDGQRPRVIKGETAGTTVFRVVFGPYNSKADAERMGRTSKHNYWVYEGVP